MPPRDCGHDDGAACPSVCAHLLQNADQDYYQHFTGQGIEYDLVCNPCRAQVQAGTFSPDTLRTVCTACLEHIEEEGCLDGNFGLPEVRERASSLSFRHEILDVEPLETSLLDIQPVEAFDRSLWVAVTQAGAVVQLDLDAGTRTPLLSLPEEPLSLADPVSLHLAPAGAMAAVVNTKGQHGVVLDLTTGRVTMRLERDTYHTRHCTFPVAFFEAGGRLLLVHGTAWNRLDISDPRTGELLTGRTVEPPEPGARRPAHYLDYFHCGLTVSPGNEHIVDNGWVWHPDGIVVTWSLRRWVGEKVWESEDGPSRRPLCHRVYCWDAPLCWLSDTRLAVYGYGDDEQTLIPAVRIFDVVGGKEEGWFPGVKGTLAFDEYLFSWHPDEGTSAWDVDTGERLLHEAGFCPRRYHRGAKQFLTVTPRGRFQLSRLRGHAIDPSWLSANDRTVGRVARGIAEQGTFDGLPALADALEEAGCAEEAILAHCRQPGPHGRRCWVLDRLLDGE